MAALLIGFLHRDKGLVVTLWFFEKAYLIPVHSSLVQKGRFHLPLKKGGGLPARSRFGEGRGGILKILSSFRYDMAEASLGPILGTLRL